MIKDFSLSKYFIIGIINSSLGYIIILSLTYLGLLAEVSNLFGYIIGIFVSYFLNKKYNFKTNNQDKKEFLRFLFTVFIAYILNLITLFITYRVLNIDVYISQVLAGIAYFIVGYILSKKYVFIERR